MKVLVYHRRGEEYRCLIRERFPELDVAAGYSAEVLDEHLGDADIVIAWWFPVERLAEARRLRWFQATSAGVEHLVPAAEALRGIVVTNTRGIHADLMADFAMGAIMMLQWDAPQWFRDQRARRWSPRLVMPLHGRTLGVVGLGAAGSEIARRGAAGGMTVVGVRRRPAPVDGVSRVFAPAELGAMLPLCDFVVVAVPGTPATRGLIGARELALMKPTSCLINIARGRIVDEAALIRALAERRIAGAVLDVFAEEPLPPDSPFWTMDNVIVTPHVAGEPVDYVPRAMEVFAENFRRWTAGEPLRNVIDFDRGY